jgi:hypothetical protein
MIDHDQPPFAPPGLRADQSAEEDGYCLLDQSLASPFRSLDWRWIVAGYLARSGSRTRPRWIDAPVRRVVNHLRRAGRPGSSLPDPGLVGALALRSGAAGAVRTAIQALLLAGLDDDAIAAAVGLGPDVVAAYHDTFFDIRPILRHPDAVIARAFGDALYAPTPDRELAIKLLSFQGGPSVALDLVAAVLLPGAGPAPDDRAEVAGGFEDYLLAWSIPADGRSLSALLGLVEQARRVDLESGLTVAAVSQPVPIGDLDDRMEAETGISMRATGPIDAVSYSSMRAEAASRGWWAGPGVIVTPGSGGLDEGEPRFGIAV